MFNAFFNEIHPFGWVKFYFTNDVTQWLLLYILTNNVENSRIKKIKLLEATMKKIQRVIALILALLMVSVVFSAVIMNASI